MKKSYVISLLVAMLLLANNCFADCEQGCRLELKCIDVQNNSQERELRDCFVGRGVYYLRTDNGSKMAYLNEIYENNGIIDVPEYFSFSVDAGTQDFKTALKVTDLATDKVIYEGLHEPYRQIHYEHKRENGKWKHCSGNEAPEFCDL